MSTAIQQRDVEILRFIFENRVTTLAQIKEKCFSKSSRPACSRRISKLCDAGFLKRGALTESKRNKSIYGLTEKALPYLASAWKFHVDKPHLKSESPDHDVRLGCIRSRLERLTVFRNFIPENLLQSSSALAEHGSIGDLVRLQTDAALIVKGSTEKDHVFAIELEVSRKNLDRYRSKLSAYYLAHNISGVIYICANKEIVSSLVKIDKDVRQNQKSILYLGLEKDVLASQGKLYFENAKEHGISFV